LTPSQISVGTAPDLNFLIAAHSQDRIDVDIRLLLFIGVVVGLSVATHAVLLKRMHLFIILLPSIRFFVLIKFSIKILSKFALYGRFLSL
jgi:hypothetical protein